MQNNILYKKLGMAIEIDLHYNGYLVRANQLKIGNRDSITYDITFELQRRDIGKWDTLDEAVFRIKSKNICSATAKLVWDKFAEGYFKPFIDRYEYELTCTNTGIEMNECKRRSAT